MKVTTGKNILILRENGTYIEIPDGRNISKNIPIDAMYAFINVSMNELPAYLMIPIDNLITHIYKCTIEYSLSMLDVTLLFDWNFSFDRSLGIPISDRYAIEIDSISDFYSFMNTFDTLSMVTECGYYGSEIYYEPSFNVFKLKLKSDRYNIFFDINDYIEEIIDQYSSATVGLIEFIGKKMNFDKNNMCHHADTSEEYKRMAKSFILKPSKGKYKEVIFKRDEDNLDIISDIKDTHCILYRITHSFVGDLYVTINKYEYSVLNNLRDIIIQIVPSVSNVKFVNGHIYGENWNEDLPYEDQLEDLRETHEEDLGQPYLGLNGMESAISNAGILYQLAPIVKMALGIFYCNNSDGFHQVDNTTLLSEMGLHIVYITFEFHDRRTITERLVLFEEDYKLSYRYIFTKLLRAVF